MKYTPIHIRNAIAEAYQEEFLSEREIAQRLNLKPSTVHYWIGRLDAGLSLQTAPKTGRPRKTDDATDQAIHEKSDSDPFLPATEIRTQLALPCTVQTVRNRLRGFGLKSRIPSKKDFLKPEHIQKRLAFALNYLHYTRWDDVVFSDEKTFYSSGHGILRVWRPTNASRYDKKYLNMAKASNPGCKVNVWGCISLNGPNEIHRVTVPNLVSSYYVSTILETILGGNRLRNLVFMQDLSPIHTSEVTKLWIHQNNVEVLPWVPKGGDINPIENVWAEMERQLSTRVVRNKNMLWDLVRDTFNNLQYSYIKSLIDSMPRRLAGVVDAEGGWTKY